MYQIFPCNGLKYTTKSRWDILLYINKYVHSYWCLIWTIMYWQYSSTKTLLVRNVGNKTAKFKLLTNRYSQISRVLHRQFVMIVIFQCFCKYRYVWSTDLAWFIKEVVVTCKNLELRIKTDIKNHSKVSNFCKLTWEVGNYWFYQIIYQIFMALSSFIIAAHSQHPQKMACWVLLKAFKLTWNSNQLRLEI